MTHREIKATATLPTRIVTLETFDGGPMEDGGTRCPHCGAEGRYIHSFLCDDGQVHAAMSGCIKLFPHRPTVMSKMAELAIQKQQELFEENRRSSNSGSHTRKLASWFQVTLDTLQKVRAGSMTLAEADRVICEQSGRRYNWLVDNGYVRGRGRRR